MDVTRWWVQHETGEILEGSQIDLCDEPVTPLKDVIAHWQKCMAKEAEAYWKGGDKNDRNTN